jgi:muconolactone delta-isomerase
MKFLVTSEPTSPMPPEAAPGLMDALMAWAKRYTESGEIEAVWATAGKAGGGGIINVDSLEELDAIMVEFPVGVFSEIQIVPIVDLNASLERAKRAFQAMAGG